MKASCNTLFLKLLSIEFALLTGTAARSFNGINDYSEIYAYMDGATIIKLGRIVEYNEIVVK